MRRLKEIYENYCEWYNEPKMVTKGFVYVYVPLLLIIMAII